MADVQHKRGTRSDLNTLAAANGLLVGQVYFITDEGRLSIATSVSAYQAAAKEGEGGLPELYAENPSSPTAPSATGTNAVAIGSGSTSSQEKSFSVMGGTASGQYSMAFNNYSVSSGQKSISFGWLTDATGISSVAIGTGTQSIGLHSVSLGQAYASGADSFAAAIANSSSSYGATGANSVAIGDLTKSTNTNSVSLGNGATSSSIGSVAIGDDASASGSGSVALGYNTVATSTRAYALSAYGRAEAVYSATLFGARAKSSVQGKAAYGPAYLVGQGEVQGGMLVCTASTSNTTAAALTTTNSAAGTTNQVILPNNSAFAFSGTIVARQQASQGTACAAWEVKGLIRREGTAGTTVLVNSATTILDNTPAWGMTLSADTTNGGLAITVTGAAATNIRFVATINTSEVTY
jgi:hypothetical protein